MGEGPGARELFSGAALPGRGIRREEKMDIDVLPAGGAPAPGERALESRCLAAQLAALREHYDLVILKLPALTAASDALAAAALADCVLVTVRYRRTSYDRLDRLLTLLARREIPVVGLACAGAREPETSAAEKTQIPV